MTLRHLATLVIILTFPAAIQAQTPEKRITWTAGAGSAIALSNTADRFGNGFEILGGVEFAAAERLDLGFEYAVSWHAIKGTFFDLPSLRGDQRLQQFAFDARYWLTDRRKTLAVYLIGGPGVYRRDISVTYFAGATDPVCDPFLLICEEDPEETLLGSRGSWDFGLNVGAGVTIPLTDYLRMSVDTRYVYIWGPKLESTTVPLPSDTPERADGQFFPIRFGFQF